MSDCRDCIHKNEIYPFGNGYHCGKSGLDFEDGVRGPECICRQFYDSYNYIKDQDAIRERNKDDLLAAIMLGGDILPDADEGQRSDDDGRDFKTFLFCFVCIIALLVSEQYGLVGLLVVFGVHYGIFRLLRSMDSTSRWKLGIGVMVVLSCFSAIVNYDTTRVSNFDRLLTENIYKNDSWQTDQDGVMYLNIAGDRPFMPLPDGQKRINGVLSGFLTDHNKRVEQRAADRNAGFVCPFQPIYDYKLEAYFVGDRIQIVSSNAPHGLFAELKERRAEKFDWQAFERNRDK